ncbi:MAG: hypothetical protein ACPGJS_20280 [Flammeovirgaceae bacterium]
MKKLLLGLIGICLFSMGYGSNTITVNFGSATSGTISVEGGNSSCLGTPASLSVSVLVSLKIAGNVHTAGLQAINGVQVDLTGAAISSFTTLTVGDYEFDNLQNQNYTVTPNKSSGAIKNGLDLIDLAQMQLHLLGVAPLNSPYKIIAAGLNQSGSVTTEDLVLMQQVILNITTTLPKNWVFVLSSYVFPKPANPFGSTFPQNRVYAPLSLEQLNEDFIRIKIGDLNLDRNTQ